MYVSSSAFLGFILVALLVVLIFMPGGDSSSPVATPEPVVLSSDVILAQAAAGQMETLSSMVQSGYAADLAVVHPTATPVPTPRPSEGERIVKQAASPVLFCGAIVGVIFLGTLAILAWESSRRRQDDALRRQQELDKMRLERDVLQARNEAEARQGVSN